VVRELTIAPSLHPVEVRPGGIGPEASAAITERRRSFDVVL